MFICRHLEEAFLGANDFLSVLLLTGARQVGKTTFLKEIATSAHIDENILTIPAPLL